MSSIGATATPSTPRSRSWSSCAGSARYVDHLTLVGRLAPEPGTLALPDARRGRASWSSPTTRGSRAPGPPWGPWHARCAASGGCSATWMRSGCSARTRWRMLFAAGRAAAAQARGARRAPGLPQPHAHAPPAPVRHLAARPCSWRASGAALGRLFPMVAVGPDLARRYRGGEVLPIVISLVDDEHVTSREEALARSYDGDLTAAQRRPARPGEEPSAAGRRARAPARARTRAGGSWCAATARCSDELAERAPRERRRGARGLLGYLSPRRRAAGPLPRQPRVPARVLDRGRARRCCSSRSPPACPWWPPRWAGCRSWRRAARY